MSRDVVDAHMHAYPMPSWGSRRKGDHEITEYGDGKPVGESKASGDIESVKAAMDAAGIDRALVLNLYEPRRVLDDLGDLPAGGPVGPTAKPGAYLMWLNRWLCAVTNATDRLHPVVAADPTALDPETLGRHLAQCASKGAVGVKVHPPLQGFAPDDARLRPLYRACADLGLPVIAHSGPGATPAAFAPALSAWPTVKFVLAHAGGASWRSTAAAIERYPNAFVDLAELIWWAGSGEHAPTLEDLRVLIGAVDADRVLFGSDFPWYEPAVGVAVVRSLDLQPAQTTAVLGGTASTIFALSSVSHSSTDSGGAL